VALFTDVPDELHFRGIEPRQDARGFAIVLTLAEPRGGGRIEGQVERRRGSENDHPLTVGVRCAAAWIDVAPELVGRKRFSLLAYGDMRTRAVPVWLEEELYDEHVDLGPLDEANWRRFEFQLPDDLPRALEGTFASFRWRVEARRGRRLGSAVASLPLLFVEPQTIPTVRVETTPIGTWRLLEWRSEDDAGGSFGPCTIAFEERRDEDMPLPGETRAEELARRMHG
jgi:hypothetical protein